MGGALLLAIVEYENGKNGKNYRIPTKQDYLAIQKANELLKLLPSGLIPIEATPIGGGSGAGRAFSIYKYGMTQWGNLFTSRQKLFMVGLVKKIQAYTEDESLKRILALVVDRVVVILWYSPWMVA